MRPLSLAFIADGRSPIARNWMKHFLASSHAVHLISTYACEPPSGLASFYVVPAALSGVAGASSSGTVNSRGGLIRRLTTPKMRTWVRQWVGPLSLTRPARLVREILQEIQPDLVHAMRIPYEGMVAAQANPNAPLLVSVWGNDFTLHAKSNPLMDMLTKRTLARANSLHTDCQRDLRLAYDLGFSAAKPSIVLPGAGGIDPNIFYPHAKPTADPVVINPRGFRAYVRNDTFFRAIPLVLAQKPDTRFICPAMVDESVAQEWVASLGIAHAVTLLPKLAHAAMAAQFRAAAVTVSPSTHDGTPNTLLEAMACGSFPVAGDIESVREWIISGENGLLFDPADHTALAQAILQALDDHELIIRTRKINQKHIQEQAIYPQVMTKAEDFYRAIL